MLVIVLLSYICGCISRFSLYRNTVTVVHYMNLQVHVHALVSACTCKYMHLHYICKVQNLKWVHWKTKKIEQQIRILILTEKYDFPKVNQMGGSPTPINRFLSKIILSGEPYRQWLEWPELYNGMQPAIVYIIYCMCRPTLHSEGSSYRLLV